eukprot:5529778-Amphidinium_carterae.2
MHIFRKSTRDYAVIRKGCTCGCTDHPPSFGAWQFAQPWPTGYRRWCFASVMRRPEMEQAP